MFFLCHLIEEFFTRELPQLFEYFSFGILIMDYETTSSIKIPTQMLDKICSLKLKLRRKLLDRIAFITLLIGGCIFCCAFQNFDFTFCGKIGESKIRTSKRKTYRLLSSPNMEQDKSESRINQKIAPESLDRRDFLRSLGLGLSSLVGSTFLTQKAGADSSLELANRKKTKTGACPVYEDLRGDTVMPFDVDTYQGLWYEQAFHDITQLPLCGCTRFNMTRRGNQMEDEFTTRCPYTWGDGSVIGNTYLVNMTMDIDPGRPGIMTEHALYYDFPNMVLDLWKGTDASGREVYNKSIQMQCVELAGVILFVGINFLTRDPLISEAELQEMFDHAEKLGLPRYGGSRQGMAIVKHENCNYPSSTDISEVSKGGTKFNIGGPQGTTALADRLITSPR